MPLPMHDHPIRALPINEMLENMGQQAGNGHAKQHAVGFAADLFPLRPKLSNQPKHANHAQ